jgi:hypothetical protein
MLDNKPNDMDWLYYNPLQVVSAYASEARAKQLRELQNTLKSVLISPPPQFPNASSKEKFLEPVSIFHNEAVLAAKKVGDYVTNEHDNQFYVSLGIFDLDTTSATATITKDNKLELTWTERAGKGKFTSTIPSYLVATSAPVLSYEGGVLDIRVNVKSRSENDVVFVGKLESK